MGIKRTVKRNALAKPVPGFKPWLIKNNELTPQQATLLRGKRIFIGTPMYGGQCFGQYAASLFQLGQIAVRCGLNIEPEFLFNESLVQRGRNSITYKFMQSSAEYLFFLDADIGFHPIQALELILAAIIQHEPLVGASYPKKVIDWNVVPRHINAGVRLDKMNHCVGAHVIHPMNDTSHEINIHELFPVKYLGTGYMLIHRSVFEVLEKKKTSLVSIEDEILSLSPEARNSMIPFINSILAKLEVPVVKSMKNDVLPDIGPVDMRAHFDCELRPSPALGGNAYLSEDYLFCARAIEAGFIPKIAPWISLMHYGTYPFEGCYVCTQGGYAHDVLALPKQAKESK